MDIDIKLRSDQEKPYIKITAVINNAEEAAHLINSIQTNANAVFERQVVFPGEDGHADDED